MKKKILAIMICALLLACMIPAGAMAEAVTNILPNGDFEVGFSGAPDEGWVTVLHSSVAGTLGDASSVTSATFGEETILPVEGSTKFLQINRHNGDGGDLSNLENRSTGMYIVLDDTKLTAGKFYRFEFYLNIPEGALSDGVHANFFFQNGSGSHVGAWRTHNWYVPSGVSYRNMTAATNGWEKKGFTFMWDGNATQLTVALYGAGAAGTMFVDELKIYETNPPALQELMGENFEGTAIASTINSASSFKVRENRGTLSIETDPAGGTNKVMKVAAANKECFAPIGMAGQSNHKSYSIFSVTDTLKLSFKIYVPAQTAKAEESNNSYTVDYAIGGETGNGFALELNYINKPADSTKSASTSGRARPTLEFDKSYVGKWINVEAYLLGFQKENPTLAMITYALTEEGALGAGAKFNFYIDDIKLEKINGGGHVSNLNVDKISRTGRAVSATVDANWAVMATGTYPESFTKTQTVSPILAYAPASLSDKGLAMAMVYKVEGDTQTLVDIKFEILGRVALADFSGFSSAAAGVASSALDIDLSTETFEAGSTYKVEYALWNMAGLAPVAESVIFNVVDAA
ncbi:MAG: hypothetical protein IJN74_05480 [Clostridia bacterium]|nr:hypothetical protein [Clostridia bacterium]